MSDAADLSPSQFARSAARAVGRVTPDVDLAPQQQAVVSAGRAAVASLGANLAVGLVAGFLGARIHPQAPQLIYAVCATTLGVYAAPRNKQLGQNLVVAGMLAATALGLRAAARLVSATPADVPLDATDLANEVARRTQAPDPVG